MIKGIARIKGLGVYENYSKPAGMLDFGVKNLIYGWNYSGKTTLSRIFAQLESKSINPDFQKCEFSVETGDQLVTEKNFQESGLTVRVFNSDFVRDNLHFGGGEFNPILLLGKESEEAQNRIDENKNRLKRVDSTRRELGRQRDAIANAISESRKEAAKNIRQLLKIDPYTATHLSSDILSVGSFDNSQLIPEKEYSDCLETALTPDSKRPSTVGKVSVSLSMNDLYEDVVDVLAAVPSFSSTIKHLEENPDIERWVEEGVRIHSHAGACEFCGNAITEDRLEAFRSHFSKDLADHKRKAVDLLQRVEAARIELTLPKDAELNQSFRQAYRTSSDSLLNAIEVFNRTLENLAADVQRKVASPRKILAPTSIIEGVAQAVTDAVEAVNAVIEENDKLVENFKAAKEDAIARVRYHHVQQFIDSLEESGQERRKARLISRHDRLQAFAVGLQARIDELQALISQAQLGREKINERLSSMLGSETIQISVVADPVSNQERFRLVRRNGRIAKNLSDGERTAIAFSYFLTKLQELKQEEFKETIVYIDDPISSLDANHIFQVSAAINEMFFSKVKNENGGEVWATTCKQIFISTHNFEFFNLMRELKPDGEKQARLFLLKRVGDLSTTLINMPKSLAKYGSEYQFLFDKIYSFHKSIDKTDHDLLLMLPNAVRRFVELYTYARIPGGYKETVDQRAIELFGKEKSKSILKFLHTFSHANTIERLAGNNELIFLIEQTVKDLLEEIEQRDERHWKALVAAV